MGESTPQIAHQQRSPIPKASSPQQAKRAATMLRLFGLQFQSREEEERYKDFRTAEYFLKEEVSFAAVRAGVVAAGFVRQLAKSGFTTSTLIILVVFFGPISQVMIRKFADWEGNNLETRVKFLRRRTIMAFVWRGVVAPVVLYNWLSHWFPGPSEGEAVSAVSYAVYFFLGSGILFIVVTCLAFPVLLEHHLYVQPFVTLIAAYWLGPSFCHDATRTAAGREYILTTWRFLNEASWKTLSPMYFVNIREESQPDAWPACRQMVTQAYFMILLVWVTYMQWLFEHKSRLLFLNCRAEGLPVGDRWRPVTRFRVASHALLQFVLFAVTWQALSDVFFDRGTRCFVHNGVPVGSCGLES